MTIGLLLLAAALSLTIYNIWDGKRAEKASAEVTKQIFEEIKDKTGSKEYKMYPEKEMPIKIIDGYRYIGIVSVPSLDLYLPVMEDWDYDKLRISPCRYAGNVYQGNMVIAGHNYAKHFSGLKNLPEGSEIAFIDMDGNVFHYVIEWTDVLEPEGIEEMVADDGWDLTLFTCTYGGGSRYTIRCVEKQ